MKTKNNWETNEVFSENRIGCGKDESKWDGCPTLGRARREFECGWSQPEIFVDEANFTALLLFLGFVS